MIKINIIDNKWNFGSINLYMAIYKISMDIKNLNVFMESLCIYGISMNIYKLWIKSFW